MKKQLIYFITLSLLSSLQTEAFADAANLYFQRNAKQYKLDSFELRKILKEEADELIKLKRSYFSISHLSQTSPKTLNSSLTEKLEQLKNEIASRIQNLKKTKNDVSYPIKKLIALNEQVTQLESKIASISGQKKSQNTNLGSQIVDGTQCDYREPGISQCSDKIGSLKNDVETALLKQSSETELNPPAPVEAKNEMNNADLSNPDSRLRRELDLIHQEMESKVERYRAMGPAENRTIVKTDSVPNSDDMKDELQRIHLEIAQKLAKYEAEKQPPVEPKQSNEKRIRNRNLKFNQILNLLNQQHIVPTQKPESEPPLEVRVADRVEKLKNPLRSVFEFYNKNDRAIVTQEENIDSFIKNGGQSFLKNISEIIEENKNELITNALSEKEPKRYYSPDEKINGKKLPCALQIIPGKNKDSPPQIIIHLKTMVLGSDKIKPGPAGEGSFKELKLAFDYESGKIFSRLGSKKSTRATYSPGNHDFYFLTKEELEKEIELQKKLSDVKIGIANSYDVHSYESKKGKEKFFVLQPFYPSTLESLIPDEDHSKDQPSRSNQNDSKKVAYHLLYGLSQMHDRGIHHRDIKPGNIFLTEEGNPKIADFGTAVSHEKQDEFLAGTPLYLSPEYLKVQRNYSSSDKDVQLQNQNLKNDVWAMGLTLWQVHFGKKPKFPSSFEELEKVSTLAKHNKNGCKVSIHTRYSDLKSKLGIDFGRTIPPRKGTVEHVLFRMLDPCVDKRISSADAFAEIEKLNR